MMRQRSQQEDDPVYAPWAPSADVPTYRRQYVPDRDQQGPSQSPINLIPDFKPMPDRI